MSKIRAFTMPKWGIEMQEGRLAEWLVNEGDTFEQGDLLALIETDKISNEVEAEFDSVLRLVTCETGETYPVGALLAVFADASVSDADVKAFADSFVAADTSTAVGEGSGTAKKPEPVAAPAPVAPAAAPAELDAERAPPPPSDNLNISPKAREFSIANRVDTTQVTGTGRGGRITYQDVYQANRPAANPVLRGALETPSREEGVFASPLAKRIALQNGIDLAGVTGTGARGRISKADVLALLKPATQAAAVVDLSNVDNTPTIVEMDRVRKVIAKRLTQSKSSVPHFYLRNSISVDALLEFRKTANLVLGVKASINDYLIKAIAVALMRHPDINIQVHDDHIHYFPHADIGVAMASENGLMSPVVRNVDLMRVDDIAHHTKALLEKCNSGKLAYQDLEGGTITISNLGMMGIDNFDAIITPPQGSIIAIGGVRRVVVEGENGEAYFESQIAISMSCDHRAIDGAAGAKFMASLREIIEAPEQLFA